MKTKLTELEERFEDWLSGLFLTVLDAIPEIELHRPMISEV